MSDFLGIDTSNYTTSAAIYESPHNVLLQEKMLLPVKKGEKGLLYVSGPSVMLGYHNNPEETQKVISIDEKGKKWINIGDIVHQ